MAGEAPNIVRGVQSDFKKLFHSDERIAIRLPVTLQAGYGVVPIGMVLAKNTSAAGNKDKLVPYDPSTVTGAEVAPGRAYLVQDSGTTEDELYVTLEDSYKFAVGDDVYVNDSETAAENLGAIKAIDRATYSHMAKITVTTETGNTSFTTARFAYLAVEGADAAVGILDASRDTGSGQNSAGALGNIVKKNAVLYTGMITNLDSDAQTDLSSEEWGQWTIV